MHNSSRYSKWAVCTPLFGVSIVAVALLIIMGCLVQAIREALATEVSVEIGKPISLLSNQALGPVLHSLIQMRVPRTGLAKLNQPPPLLHHFSGTHITHTVTVSASVKHSQPYLVYLLCSLAFFLELHCSCAHLTPVFLIKVILQRTKNGFVSHFVAIRNPDTVVFYGSKVVWPGVWLCFFELWSNNNFLTF